MRRRKDDGPLPSAAEVVICECAAGPACSEGSVMDPLRWFWRNSRGARGATGECRAGTVGEAEELDGAEGGSRGGARGEPVLCMGLGGGAGRGSTREVLIRTTAVVKEENTDAWLPSLPRGQRNRPVLGRLYDTVPCPPSPLSPALSPIPAPCHPASLCTLVLPRNLSPHTTIRIILISYRSYAAAGEPPRSLLYSVSLYHTLCSVCSE